MTVKWPITCKSLNNACDASLVSTGMFSQWLFATYEKFAFLKNFFFQNQKNDLKAEFFFFKTGKKISKAGIFFSSRKNFQKRGKWICFKSGIPLLKKKFRFWKKNSAFEKKFRFSSTRKSNSIPPTPLPPPIAALAIGTQPRVPSKICNSTTRWYFHPSWKFSRFFC